MPDIFICNFAKQKLAACIANYKLGLISSKNFKAIEKACKKIISGNLTDQFPITVWQTGSGTQSNMNLNEVISNLSNQDLGSNVIHPNDHVNMSQSSNDSFPTAMNITIVSLIKTKLFPALSLIENTLNTKAKKFKGIKKISRTHMQDAVPIDIYDEFITYKNQIENIIKSVNFVMEKLLYLPQGGSAVGNGINVPKKFPKIFITSINKLTKLNFKECPLKQTKIAAHDDLSEFMSIMNVLSQIIFKLSNDIKILVSGPRAGIFDYSIPKNEKGSSIMPGKSNPTQAESIAMVALEIMGMCHSVAIANASGNLQLNVFKPLILLNCIRSINLISEGISNFTINCLNGITPNEIKVQNDIENSIMLSTYFAPVIGYDRASELCDFAISKNISIKKAAKEFLKLKDKQIKDILQKREK